MEFTREHWTQQDYQQLVEQLRELADPDYLAFNQKLVPDCSNMLGVRMPELRRLSRQIVKGNAEEYLALAGAGSHEEILLHGMVIGALDCDFEALKGYIAGFVPKISNWAVCDSFCSGLKQFGKEQQAAYELVESYALSSSPWAIRFGLISMLSHFLNDLYIDRVLAVSGQITNDHYYVRMGNAWLISMAFVKYRDKTLAFLNDCALDDWTYNKALQKIVESNRVDAQTKELIKTLKR